jgi:hypothetical protein
MTLSDTRAAARGARANAPLTFGDVRRRAGPSEYASPGPGRARGRSASPNAWRGRRLIESAFPAPGGMKRHWNHPIAPPSTSAPRVRMKVASGRPAIGGLRISGRERLRGASRRRRRPRRARSTMRPRCVTAGRADHDSRWDGPRVPADRRSGRTVAAVIGRIGAPADVAHRDPVWDVRVDRRTRRSPARGRC